VQTVAGVFVPEGLDEGSLAVYCQGMRSKKTRPVGHGLSWSTGTFTIQGGGMFLPTQSYRSLRDGFRFLAIPGSKLLATITWSLRDKKLF
jgi:hypothetical protein